MEEKCPVCGSKLKKKVLPFAPCAGAVPYCPKCGWGDVPPRSITYR